MTEPLGLRTALGALAMAIVVSTAGCSGDSTADDAAPTTAPSTASSTTSAGEEPTSSTDQVNDEVPAGIRASEGCEATPPPGFEPEGTGDAEFEVESGGTTRTYRLGVPADDAEPGPYGLILNLHGSGSNAIEQSVYSELAIHGPARGYVVITPDAIDRQWELDPEGDDDDFLMALVDKISAERCIDLDRIHAAGISLGSWKASVTACSHQDRFASIVLVAEEVAPLDCALPVVAFHGTADLIVPYGSGADDGAVVTGSNAGLPGVEVNMPNWARQAGCSEEKDVRRLEPDVDHWIYRDCPEGFDVELYSIDGGGHTWPGSPIKVESLGATTDTIDATTIALDWFDAHPLHR